MAERRQLRGFDADAPFSDFCAVRQLRAAQPTARGAANGSLRGSGTRRGARRGMQRGGRRRR
jgi:hypothetical protein